MAAVSANPISKSETWERIIQAGNRGDASSVVLRINEHLQAHADESLDKVERRLRVENSVIYIFAETIAEKTARGHWLPGGSCVDIRTGERREYAIRVLISSYSNLVPVINRLNNNPRENLRRLKDQTGVPIAPKQVTQMLLRKLFEQ